MQEGGRVTKAKYFYFYSTDPVLCQNKKARECSKEPESENPSYVNTEELHLIFFSTEKKYSSHYTFKFKTNVWFDKNINQRDRTQREYDHLTISD